MRPVTPVIPATPYRSNTSSPRSGRSCSGNRASIPTAIFFALGGQSLQAIQCLARIREKTPVLLSLSEFFENATVAQLAALVRRRMKLPPTPNGAGGMTARGDMQTIPLRGPTQPCKLSPAQERIWFMEQVNNGEPVYNESEAVRFKGVLDIA